MTASATLVGASSWTDDADIARFRAMAARIDRLVTRIDAALTSQINAILHTPAFQQMEARWRALAQLVDHAGTEQGVIVRVLDAGWQALARNLERAADFDQSHLFRLVYDGEFGMPGGQPFGLLVGDYRVSHRTDRGRGDQIEVLRRLAAVAAAGFCPMILGAAPDLLGFETYRDISPAADLDLRADRVDTEPDRLRWESLRRSEDVRFLGLVAPGIRIRAPWHRYEVTRTDGFTFDEARDKPLIANGAFAFAMTVIAAYQDNGWFAAIRGVDQDASGGGGHVPGFAPSDFGTDRHGLSAQTPTEFRPTAAQEGAMIERGLIPLAALYMDPDPVFNANPSLHRPAAYDSAIAAQNARLAAMLQYVLCTARFAHYIKVIMRDEIGSVAEPATIRTRLTDWLREYCIGNDDAAPDLKAQYPLRDAEVEVHAIAGRPGAYACTIRLQPHFQLDDISTSFHLVAEGPGRPAAERISA